MAKFVIPAILRETVEQIEFLLATHYGIPMNYTLPRESIYTTGRVVIHFPGTHFVAQIASGDQEGVGFFLNIYKLSGKIWFSNEEDAKKFMDDLKKIAGEFPCELTIYELRFVLKHENLLLLEEVRGSSQGQ